MALTFAFVRAVRGDAGPVTVSGKRVGHGWSGPKMIELWLPGMSLSTEPVARRSDPETSRIAAARMRFKAGSHRARILHALDFLGPVGATHRELARETGLEPVQVDRRLVELRRLGVGARLGMTRGQA